MSLPSVTGLDHYIIRVNDLQAATDRYVKLGFSLAPQGRHHRGTRNQTIILDANYLELLTFPEELKAQSRFAGFDDAYEGPVATALQTTDSTAVHAELARLGIAAEPPVSGGRPVHLPEGSEDAAWNNTQFPAGLLGVPDFFTCGHLTRHLVYRPEWQDHANGARRIEALIAVYPQPQSLRAGYERVFGAISTSDLPDGGLQVRRGSLRIDFLTPAAFEQRYPHVRVPAGLPEAAEGGWFAGSVIGVRDLERTRKLFDTNQVTYRANARGELVVAPIDAGGALQVFVQEA
ncbi:VOC family protein [Achromobacter sp.]|uniref:VOC family protein n=1 Tax=Achromobacter sp. TaxID=134375 RepID=UPI0028A8D21C|nr:VOC family protein [Achromobacter sp.]